MARPSFKPEDMTVTVMGMELKGGPGDMLSLEPIPIDIRRAVVTTDNRSRRPLVTGAAGVSFLPLSWTLKSVEVGGTPHGRRVTVVGEAVNVDTGEMGEVGMRREFDLQTPVAEAIRQVVRSLLLHEIDECLFVNGKHLRDPHPEERR